MDKETCFVKTEKNHYGVGHTLSFIYHNLFEKEKKNKGMHVKKWNKLKMLFFFTVLKKLSGIVQMNYYFPLKNNVFRIE